MLAYSDSNVMYSKIHLSYHSLPVRITVEFNHPEDMGGGEMKTC